MSRDVRNLLAYRIGGRALRRVAPLARGRLLDIGCGNKQWEPVFAPFVSEYVGVDHPGTLHDATRADILASAYEIPVPDGSFDTVLCTAVMEHLEEPALALAEARRVIAPDGVAIYAIPFFWHLHEEPRDFFRYSRFGIEHLFTNAGFRVERIDALAGFWVTMGQMTTYYLWRFRRGRLSRAALSAVCVGVQAVALALDRADRAEEWTWMYLVVARPASQA